ncbi:GNAT family N-acetyltransferase [Arhodomonas sp. AD133]|uniref:GNAT family N-acetyltransferase n=1 Tax=Arhodomonas sp. AD133 TaxID=3415009 RepID=UPI003EBCA993
MNGYTISTDATRMDVDLVHAVLAESYWAAGIPRDVVARSIEHSLCFGVFTDAGEQVAFARAVTDYATFAYIGDVFVVAAHQGRGLGKWLMRTVMDDPRLQGLRRMLLATRDAHGLYEPLGFTPLADPEMFMERWDPEVYRRGNSNHSVGVSTAPGEVHRTG